MIEERFKELGLLEHCVFVYNGEELVLKFSELTSQGISVKYILTDFQMPRMNGQIALEKIKESLQKKGTSEEIATPKFAFLTAFKTKGFENLVRHLQAQVIEKPLELDALKAFLAS